MKITDYTLMACLLLITGMARLEPSRLSCPPIEITPPERSLHYLPPMHWGLFFKGLADEFHHGIIICGYRRI